MFYFVSEKNKEEYFWKCSVNYKVNFVLLFFWSTLHFIQWTHFYKSPDYSICEFLTIFVNILYAYLDILYMASVCVCALDGCVCQIFHKWWLLENEMSIYEKWFQVWLYWILISNIFGNDIMASNQRLYIFVGVSPNIAKKYIYMKKNRFQRVREKHNKKKENNSTDEPLIEYTNHTYWNLCKQNYIVWIIQLDIVFFSYSLFQ